MFRPSWLKSATLCTFVIGSTLLSTGVWAQETTTIQLGVRGPCLALGEERNGRDAARLIAGDCDSDEVLRFEADTFFETGYLRAGGQCVDPQEDDFLWLFSCSEHPAKKFVTRDGKLFNAAMEQCATFVDGPGDGPPVARMRDCRDALQVVGLAEIVPLETALGLKKGSLAALGAQTVTVARREEGLITGRMTVFGREAFLTAFTAPRKKTPIILIGMDELALGDIVPNVDDTPLSRTGLRSAVFSVVLDDAAAEDVDIRRLPDPVKDALSIVLDKGTNQHSFTPGLTLNGRIGDFGKALKEVLDLIGVRDRDLGVSISLPAQLVSVDHSDPSAIGKAVLKLPNDVKESIQVTAQLPRLIPPGVDKILEVERPRMILGANINPRFEGVMELKLPGKTLPFSAEIELLGLTGMRFSGKTDVNWRKVLGVPFIDFNGIELSGELAFEGRDSAMSLGLRSLAKLGRQEISALGTLAFENEELKDFSIALEGEVEPGRLPGFDKIPGMNEFVFENLQLGMRATTAQATWKRLGTKGTAVIMNNDDSLSLMFSMDQPLQLERIIPNMPDPLRGMALPSVAFFLSTGDVEDVTVEDLPPAAVELLSNFVPDQTYEVPIKAGVGLMASFNVDDLPKAAKKFLEEDLAVVGSVSGGLVLSGGVEGLLDGSLPKLTLRAKLPGYGFPKNQPLAKILQFDRAGVEFMVRMIPASTSFQFGVAGVGEITIPQIGNPADTDKLKGRVEAFFKYDLVAPVGGVNIAMNVDGMWRKPLGLNDRIAIEDPAFLVGVDGDIAVEVGVGGNIHIKTRGGNVIEQQGDFIVAISLKGKVNFPKKLGIRMAINEIDLFTVLDIVDSVHRGVLSGPMAQEVLKELAKIPGAGKDIEIARQLIKKIGEEDISIVSQLDKIPLPLLQFNDILLEIATPGAVIPGRDEAFPTLGFTAEGGMQARVAGKTVKLARAVYRMNLVEGMVIEQKAFPIEIAGLRMESDVAMKMHPLGYAEFIGKDEYKIWGQGIAQEYVMTPSLLKIHGDLQAGPLAGFTLTAQAGTEDIRTFEGLAEADMLFELRTTSKLATFVADATKLALDELEKTDFGTAALESLRDAANQDRDNAWRAVNDARDEVRRERQTAENAIRDAESSLEWIRDRIRAASSDARYHKDRIGGRCDVMKRHCVGWGPFRRCASIPDPIATGKCVAEKAYHAGRYADAEKNKKIWEGNEFVAEKALEAAKGGVTLFPVDADPRVAIHLSRLGAVTVTADAANLAARGIEPFTRVKNAVMESMRSDPRFFTLEEFYIRGSLKDLVAGDDQILRVVYSSFGRRYVRELRLTAREIGDLSAVLAKVVYEAALNAMMQGLGQVNGIASPIVSRMESLFVDKRKEDDRILAPLVEAYGDAPLAEGEAPTPTKAAMYTSAETLHEKAAKASAGTLAARERIFAARAKKFESLIDEFGEGSRAVSIRARDEARGVYMCLKATNEKNGRGASKIIFDECSDEAAQLFVLDGENRLRGIGGRCVDYQEGGRLWLYSCTGHPGMIWQISDTVRLYNPHTDKCVRGVGATIRVGTQAEVDDCKGRSAVIFTNQTLPLAINNGKNGENALCLTDVRSIQNDRGATEALFRVCDASVNQTFVLRPDGMVENTHGECLDPQERDLLYFYDCEFDRRKVFDVSRGSLVQRETGMCVRAFGGPISDNAHGELADCSQRSAQASAGL